MTFPSSIRFSARLARIIVLLLVAATLQACSAIKIGYNNADSLTYWWLDGYLDLNDVQSVRLRDDLEKLHQWHRSSELPQYADLLQRVQPLMTSTTVTPEQACAIVAEVQLKIDALAARAEGAVVPLAMSVTPAQLTHLEAKYARTNADYRSKWLQPTTAEMRKMRYESTLERVEMIYGRLDDAQRATVRQHVEASVFDPRISVVERLRRQQDILQTLRGVTAPGVSVEQATVALRGMLERSRYSPDPVFRAYVQKQYDEACQSFALAHNTVPAAQRETALRRLKAYERDLRELSSRR